MSQASKHKQPELGAAMLDVLRRPAGAGTTPGLAAIVNGTPLEPVAVREEPVATSDANESIATVAAPRQREGGQVARVTADPVRVNVESARNVSDTNRGSSEASRASAGRRSNASTSSSVREKVEFEIETGRGTKSVTFRVPKEMAGRIKLMAVQRQLSGQEGPRTINEIGMAALSEWIDRNAA
jgi:hypothetical protein